MKRFTVDEIIEAVEAQIMGEPVDFEIEKIEVAVELLKERKTGKWIDRTICSNCNWYAKNRYGLAEDSNFPYCPNCGAKMEVDE